MKKITTILLIIVFYLTACSQQAEKNTKSNLIKDQEMNDTLITSKNFVEKVAQKVKHYEREPIWFYYIVNRSYYEIYTNDLPTQKYYGEGGLANRIEFNKSILKTGKQKIRIRIFPDDENAELSFYFRVKIGYYFKDKPRYDDHIITKEIEFQKSDFKKTGENVYETTYEFEAEVPYENKGWSEGQDLRKYDPKELEKAVLAFYQKMWDIYNDKSKIDAQFPLIYNREVESAQSQYFDKNDIEESLSFYLDPYNLEYFAMQPIENYKMVYYGDGKMVVLESTSMDKRFRGTIAIWAKIKFNGQETVRSYLPDLYLYLPQGKSLEDGLEIIR
jgi:hypothetical protein